MSHMPRMLVLYVFYLKTPSLKEHTRIRPQDGRRLRALRAALGLLALLTAILAHPNAAFAQTDCLTSFTIWGENQVWNGTFTLQVTATDEPEPNSFGGIATINASAQASYRTTDGPDTAPSYPPGVTTFTSAQGTVSVTETFPCDPPPGSSVETHRGSGVLTNTTINVQISLDCTYSVSFDTYVVTEVEGVSCYGETFDNGPVLVEISSGGCTGPLCNLPLPPIAQPLTGNATFAAPATIADGVPTTVTVTWSISPLNLQLTSLQTPAMTGDLHSFITTDPITLVAMVTPAVPNLPVKWTVQGLMAANGVGGFPKDEVVNTDASGASTFTFTPSHNSTYVQYRQTQFTSASPKPNPPIQFEVTAELDNGVVPVLAVLSQTTLGLLEQDETDILRQEYVDFQDKYPALSIAVPDRTSVVPSLGGNWNRGNYRLQLDMNLMAHFNSILSAYQGRSITTSSGQVFTIPANAQLVVTRGGGFRNPRENLAARSVHPESLHTQGRALDLVPLPPGPTFDLHAVLYPALAAAAKSTGLNPLAEIGPVDTHGDWSNPSVNHVHVQW